MRPAIRRLGLFPLALLAAASASAEANDASAPEAAPAAIAPEAAPAPVAPDAAVAAVAPSTAQPALGPVGHDTQGRPGHIHVVVRGDTLWDISEAYLGTPWAWPPIWNDNEDIANPHRIYPGDRIWITPWEMRRVSAEEAAALLANPPSPPAAMGEAAPPEAAPAPAPVAPEQVYHRESAEETVGLLLEEEVEGAASIVSAVPERVLLGTDDRVYVGLGREETKAGDRYSIFRKREKVFDPDTGRMLGWHVEQLGWLEIVQPGDETSMARIRLAGAEIEVGDRVIPRQTPVLDTPIGPSPEGVDGRIAFFPDSRTQMGSQDFVYLNRGSEDGIAVGSPLEVYRPGYDVREAVRAEEVRVPDRAIATMLVLKAQPKSAVAVVLHTEDELAIGDRFRGSSAQ